VHLPGKEHDHVSLNDICMLLQLLQLRSLSAHWLPPTQPALSLLSTTKLNADVARLRLLFAPLIESCQVLVLQPFVGSRHTCMEHAE
jgi:hypothetical protein